MGNCSLRYNCHDENGWVHDKCPNCPQHGDTKIAAPPPHPATRRSFRNMAVLMPLSCSFLIALGLIAAGTIGIYNTDRLSTITKVVVIIVMLIGLFPIYSMILARAKRQNRERYVSPMDQFGPALFLLFLAGGIAILIPVSFWLGPTHNAIPDPFGLYGDWWGGLLGFLGAIAAAIFGATIVKEDKEIDFYRKMIGELTRILRLLDTLDLSCRNTEVTKLKLASEDAGKIEDALIRIGSISAECFEHSSGLIAAIDSQIRYLESPCQKVCDARSNDCDIQVHLNTLRKKVISEIRFAERGLKGLGVS